MTTHQHHDTPAQICRAWAIVLGFLTLTLIVIPWLIATAPLTLIALAAVLAVWAFRRRR